MTEMKFTVVEAYMGNRGAFCFENNTLKTVSDEGLMKTWLFPDLKNNGFVDIPSDGTSLVRVSENKYILGNKSGEVLSLDTPGDLIKSEIIGRKNSTINKLQISKDNKFLLVVSEDSTSYFFDLNEKYSYSVIPGHEGPVRNASLDPLGKYIASIGCDGILNIIEIIYSSIEIKEKKIEFLLRFQKSIFPKILPNSECNYDICWMPKGDGAFIGGCNYLKYIERNSWEISNVLTISHQKEISLICLMSPEIIATFDIEFKLSIWDKKSSKLIAYYSHNANLFSLEYLESQNLLCFIDKNGNLGCSEFKLENKANPNLEDLSLEKILPFEEEKENLKANQNINIGQIKETEKNIEKNTNENKIKETNEIDENEYLEQLNKEKSNDSIEVKAVRVMPQESFQNGESDYSGRKIRFLSLNTIGSIILRNENSYMAIDIDFFDKTFHQSISVNDSIGVYKGTLSFAGALLCSKTKEINLDEYEEESEIQSKLKDNSSKILFIPFQEWRGTKQWIKELPLEESAECLAIGTRWLACSTTENNIWILSHEGIQLHLISLATPLVAIAGYENLLSICYHSGVPIYECQSLSLRTIDTEKKFSTIVQTQLPVSSSHTLQWLGYSEEGMLYSYDTNSILRAFCPFYGDTWMPVLDLKKEKYIIYLIVGITDYEALYIKLNMNLKTGIKEEITLSHKSQIKTAPISPQYLNNSEASKNSLEEKEQIILTEQFKLYHEQSRSQNWLRLKLTRSKNVPEYNQTESIKNEEELLKLGIELDKIIIDAIRICCVSDQIEKAISFTKMLNEMKSFKIAADLANYLKKARLAETITEIFEEKSLMASRNSTENVQTATKILKSIEQYSKMPQSIGAKILESRKLHNALSQSQRPVSEDIEDPSKTFADNQISKVSNFNEANRPKNANSPLLQNPKPILKNETRKIESELNTIPKKELSQLEEDLQIIALDDKLRSKTNPFKKEGIEPTKTKLNPLEKLIMKGSNTLISEPTMNSLHSQEDKIKKINK